MERKIKVAVSGAGGRMGREVVKMVLEAEELILVAAIDAKGGGDAARLVGQEPCGVEVTDDLETALSQSGAEVLVDFTTPQSVLQNAKTAISCGVRRSSGRQAYLKKI